jgi:hypothetical protein
VDLSWNPLGAMGLLVGVVTAALGFVLYKARSDHVQNRFLSLYLVLFGAGTAVFNGLRLFAVDPRDAYALMITGLAAVMVGMGAYVLLLSTLDSPLVAWMRRFGIRWIIAALFLVAAVDCVTRPRAWILGVEPMNGFTGWTLISTPLRLLYTLVLSALLIFSAIPALDSWRRAAPGMKRRQARIFAISFVGASVNYGAFLAWYLALGVNLNTPASIATNFIWQSAAGFALVIGLAYGVLKFQMFDIDLKIKWTVRKGTLAAAFVGIFFVVSEGAQTLFSARLGPGAGLLAAGALVFAIAPLQRFADRLGDAAMPRVQDTAEYRTVRKREVYRAAVESALEESGISVKERGMLATLAEQLGVGPKEMHDIERDAQSARAGVA